MPVVAELTNVGDLVVTNEFEEFTNYDSTIGTNNLLRNGDGAYADNTNFTSFVYQPSWTGFSRVSGYSTFFVNDYIKVQGNGLDTFDQYKIQCDFRQSVVVNGYTRYYFFIACYDKNKRFISHWDVAHYTNTYTTLAQTLNPGDRWVYLTSAANWQTTGNVTDETDSTYHHTKSISMWPSDDVQYPDYTYSRHHGSVSYSDTTGNRVYLTSGWAGPTIPAGSAACNSYAGGTYSYIGASYVLMTGDWVTKIGTSSSTANIGSMRYGSEYIRVGWLLNNSAVTTEQADIRSVKCWNITDVTQAVDWPDQEYDFLDSTGKSLMGCFNEVDSLETGVKMEIREDNTVIVAGEINEIDGVV